MITTYLTECKSCMEGTMHPLHDDGSDVVRPIPSVLPKGAVLIPRDGVPCDCECHRRHG